jgi:hypothetical protein
LARCPQFASTLIDRGIIRRERERLIPYEFVTGAAGGQFLALNQKQ